MKRERNYRGIYIRREQLIKIFVVGYNGLVGSAIVRKLQHEGFHNSIVCSYSELYLTNKIAVNKLQTIIKKERLDNVSMAAAKVGGMQVNREVLNQLININVVIEFNTIIVVFRTGIKKLSNRGSVHSQSKKIHVDFSLEVTNGAYALSRISGLKLCE